MDLFSFKFYFCKSYIIFIILSIENKIVYVDLIKLQLKIKKHKVNLQLGGYVNKITKC